MLTSPTLNLSMSVVSAMIAPAILILAAGSLVSSTLVRLGRVVDQTRTLIQRGEELRRTGNSVALAVVDRRIDRQLRRAELTRRALGGYYLAIGLFLLASLIIAITELLHVALWLGPLIIILGGAVLIGATSALVFEVNLSAGTLREEIESYRAQEREGAT
jgi:hypothetical protein